MTKVEELRGQIVDMADGVSFSEITCFLGLLDSYAAVSRAEGVAEGAEQARPKIAESTEKLIDWILAMEPPYESANPQWSRKVLLDLVATATEQERERILKPLVDRHWNCKVAELREGIVGDLTQLAFLGGKHPEMTWGELRHKYANPVVDSFIAACLVQGRAEGAWAEIEFLKQNTRNDIEVGRYLPYDNFLHPEELSASVLAPTKEVAG